MNDTDISEAALDVRSLAFKHRPWFIMALSGLAALFLFAIVVLMFSDVVMRYGYDASIFGGFEIIGFLLGLLIFSGFPVVTYDREHIAVGLLDHSFRGRGAWWRDVIIAGANAGAILFMAFAVLDEAFLLHEEKQVGQVLDIEIAPIMFVMSTLAFIAFLLSLCVFWDLLKSKPAVGAT